MGLMWWVPLNDFHALGQPCLPEINPAILWRIILFMCSWLPSILSKNSAPAFMQMWVYSFPAGSPSGFGIRVVLFSSSNLGKSL